MANSALSQRVLLNENNKLAPQKGARLPRIFAAVWLHLNAYSDVAFARFFKTFLTRLLFYFFILFLFIFFCFRKRFSWCQYYKTYFFIRHWGHRPGSSKAKGREPKSCLGRVFKFKLGRFTKCVHFMTCTNTAESRLQNSAQVLSC